jgi:hypothetical protein
MSISTYAELQTAVKNWLHRADLDSMIPDFITLAEVRVYNGGNASEPLRVAAMQNQATGTIASQSIALPTGYLETIRLAGVTGGQNYTLDYLAPGEFSYYENQSGDPQYFTIMEGEIKTAPNGGVDYLHDYYKKFDALSVSATTNWLLTNAPNIYLYGTLLEATPYLINDNRLQLWQAMFSDAIAGLNKSEKKRYQSNAMRVVVA